MDIGRVLSRSVEIGWRYRVLWVLALIYVLFGGGSSFSAGNTTSNRSGSSITPPSFAPGSLSQQASQMILIVVALVLCFAFFWFLLSLYFRFVARGALVAAVRSIENGAPPTFGSAWREGQKYWGRLLGLGFLVNLPLTLLGLAAVVCVFALFSTSIMQIASQFQNGQLGQTTDPSTLTSLISAFLGAFALICCAVLCLALIQIVIHPIYQLAVRAIVVEEKGAVDGLKRGYRQAVSNLGSVALVYLALIGIRILYAIVAVILGLLFGLIALSVSGALSQQMTMTTILILVALLIPVALLFFFFESIFQVLEQTVWTEAYLALLNPPGAVAPAGLTPAPIAPVAPPPPGAP
ncbi:MAG: hypothetical protein WCF84_23660 [Anaerolineae bacterium]